MNSRLKHTRVVVLRFPSLCLSFSAGARTSPRLLVPLFLSFSIVTPSFLFSLFHPFHGIAPAFSHWRGVASKSYHCTAMNEHRNTRVHMRVHACTCIARQPRGVLIACRWMRFHPFSLSSSSFRDACARDLENEGSFSWWSSSNLRVRTCVRSARFHTAAPSFSPLSMDLAIEFIFYLPLTRSFHRPPLYSLFSFFFFCYLHRQLFVNRRSVSETDYGVLVIWSIKNRPWTTPSLITHLGFYLIWIPVTSSGAIRTLHARGQRVYDANDKLRKRVTVWDDSILFKKIICWTFGTRSNHVPNGRKRAKHSISGKK